MGIRSWLLETEKRFAWSLAGTLIGVVSLVVAYVTIIEKKPRVTFTVVNQANVLDVHRSVSNLAVTFDGVDLQKRNLNLRILTVRLENLGDVDILQTYYDQREPWGFAISNGRLVEARVAASNSDYLRRSIRPVIHGSAVQLGKPMLERGKYVLFDVLVIHERRSDPVIQSFGKILGMERPDVVRLPRTPTGSIWQRAFAGSPLVQAMRTVSYFFLLLLVILLIAATISLIVYVFGTAGRRRRRKHVRRARTTAMTEQHDVFFGLYVKYEMQGLLRARALISNEKHLQLALHRMPLSHRDERFDRRRALIHGYESVDGTVVEFQMLDAFVAAYLLERGVIDRIKDHTFAPTQGAREAVEEVIIALAGGA